MSILILQQVVVELDGSGTVKPMWRDVVCDQDCQLYHLDALTMAKGISRGNFGIVSSVLILIECYVFCFCFSIKINRVLPTSFTSRTKYLA